MASLTLLWELNPYGAISVPFWEHFNFGARYERIGNKKRREQRDGQKQRRTESEVDERGGSGHR
jgi:hypothetical protein